jgi:hypothetical protein
MLDVMCICRSGVDVYKAELNSPRLGGLIGLVHERACEWLLDYCLGKWLGRM